MKDERPAYKRASFAFALKAFFDCAQDGCLDGQS
jgi:hypothetical protein